MSPYKHFLDVAVDAATAAGVVIHNAFKKPKHVQEKSGAVDLVTETDKQCENIIFSKLKEHFPKHQLIGEETSSSNGGGDLLTDEPTWMVDPLDGTTNFVHSYPLVCVSIALAIKKEIVVGVVFNPVSNELFTAVKGEGAFLGGTQIKVSTQDQLGKALFATEVGVTRDDQTLDAIFDRMRTLTCSMRSMRCGGSCALNMCSVACGRIDAFYEIGFGGCWDAAAGCLIVQEAGGKVLDPAGKTFDVMARRVLAANAHLADPIAALLASCKVSASEPGPPAV